MEALVNRIFSFQKYGVGNYSWSNWNFMCNDHSYKSWVLVYCFNPALSVVILLVSVYSKKPLDFLLPSVLLVMTLFRLSLNIASTRNILLRGGDQRTSTAGQIIKSFGEFVVEGNYIVGIIVFIILVIINFGYYKRCR